MAAYTEVLPWDAPRDKWLVARRDGIGASDIAAVLGISPYESPAGLWYRKRGELGPREFPANGQVLRGHRLEPVVADWFEADHPEFHTERVGLVRSTERPWQQATPDRLLFEDCTHDGTEHDPLAPLECKTTYSWDGWGEPGTDQIPVHYRAQVLWQMDTLGLRSAYVAVLGFNLQYREYEVGFDTNDVLLMRDAAEAFWKSVLNNERPDLDAHDATTAALVELHPDVKDVDVEVPAELADEYDEARAGYDKAEMRLDEIKNRLRDAIGDGKRAMCNGRRVVTRSVYEQDSFNLPRFRDEHPALAAQYLRKITINKLIPPPKPKKVETP